EGVAAICVVLGVAFWLGLATDWLLEPSPAIRLLLWGAVVVAVAIALWRYVGTRLRVPLPDDSLALLMERKYPQLRDGLVTTVQAASERIRHRNSTRSSRAQAMQDVEASAPMRRQLLALASRSAAAAMPEI